MSKYKIGCCVCGKGFVNQSALNRHYISIHNDKAGEYRNRKGKITCLRQSEQVKKKKPGKIKKKGKGQKKCTGRLPGSKGKNNKFATFQPWRCMCGFETIDKQTLKRHLTVCRTIKAEAVEQNKRMKTVAKKVMDNAITQFNEIKASGMITSRREFNRQNRLADDAMISENSDEEHSEIRWEGQKQEGQQEGRQERDNKDIKEEKYEEQKQEENKIGQSSENQDQDDADDRCSELSDDYHEALLKIKYRPHTKMVQTQSIIQIRSDLGDESNSEDTD